MTQLGALIPSLQERLEAMRQKALANPDESHAPNCKRCDDTKWVVVDGYARRCPECVGGQAEAGAPSTPYEFRGAMLGNYDQMPGNAAALKAARLWLDGKKDLFLYGGVGCGKTRLACSLLNEHYRKHRGGMFTRISGMLFNLQPKEDRAEDRFMVRLVENPVLVLDDLGAEREDASDFSRRTILQVYEERGDRGNRTIWTSNKSLQELSEQLGDERLVSRIGGRAEIVKLTTSDQRMRRR